MRLFKGKKDQVKVRFCETCGEVCDSTCTAERRLEQIKTTLQSDWGGRVGR